MALYVPSMFQKPWGHERQYNMYTLAHTGVHAVNIHFKMSQSRLVVRQKIQKHFL